MPPAAVQSTDMPHFFSVAALGGGSMLQQSIAINTSNKIATRKLTMPPPRIALDPALIGPR
jgi:hypothetical protein